MANETLPPFGTTPAGPEGQMDAITQAMIAEQIALGREARRRYTPSPTELFVFGLKDYAKKEKEGKLTDEERKEMRERYERFSSQCLQPIEKLFDQAIDRKISAYPFQSGYGEAVYGGLHDTLTELGEEAWLEEGTEAWVFYKNAERDLAFTDGLFHTAVGLSASKPAYFDVILQLSTLKQQRIHVLTKDLEGMWSGRLEGLDFDATQNPKTGKSEIELLKQSGAGISLPDKYDQEKTGIYKEFGERLPGLRELAVKFQDERMAWVIRVAAVSQYDYRKTNPNEKSFMGSNLKNEELNFINELFGRTKKKGGFYILSPYISSKSGDKKDFDSLMLALLLSNSYNRLQEIIKSGDDEVAKSNKISELVQDVKGVANERRINWRKKDLNDPVANLAKIVVRQGALQDYSLMIAVDFCWEYVWKDGTFKKIKKVELGRIYSDSGDLPSLYWAHRRFNYALKSQSATQVLPPTSKKSRKEVMELPLSEMPKYEPGEHPDMFLKDQWDFLFSNDSKYRQLRAGMGYPDIPPEIAATLQKWAWRWGTPFTSGYVGEKSNYDLDIIFFMPPDLAIANFFRSVTDLDGDLNEGTKSVMRQLIEGKKLSEVDLNKIDVEQVDRWLVDCEMASRYMRIMIEVFDKERDPFFALVAGDPSTLGPQELAKRLYLTFRDSEDAPPSLYELALIPFFITQACAQKYGISSASAWKITTEEDSKTNTTSVDRFMREMAYWKRALMWLPDERGVAMEEKGWTEESYYGKILALLAEHYQQVLLRIAKSSAEESVFNAKERYQQTYQMVKGQAFYKQGSLPHDFIEPGKISLVAYPGN